MGFTHGMIKRLDQDAIDRVLARVPAPTKPQRKGKSNPRSYKTYRGYIRNVAIHKRRP